jgi:predicted dehydrogenase
MSIVSIAPAAAADALTASTTKTRTLMIGVGGMARHHLPSIISRADTEVVAICEPSAASYAAAGEIFTAAGLPVPPNLPDLEALLVDHASEIDAAFIITPHVLHHAQASMTLQAGIDVLLEKPMVMNAAEARDLIKVQQETGRLLTVAFNGSLSPQVRTAVRVLRSGELGRINSISATVWQNWYGNTIGTWRQIPEISGGGYMFDTGAHMLNTVVDLAGEPAVEVMAILDNREAPVDVLGMAMARLKSGALLSLHGSGDTLPKKANSMGSDVRVFCTEGQVYTGVWGERLEIQRADESTTSPVAVPASTGAWEQFLRVRAGEIENPCPPQVGLRMALLWDAIQASSRAGGTPVTVAAE